jgi:hypothetical protein
MSATKLSRRRGPKPDRRRALELLAGSRDGMTEAMLLAHGFTVDMLVDLIRAGLATANTERMVAGGGPIEVTHVRITDAGQRTHEDRTPTHGYAATREAAMAAFRKSWRRERLND